MRPDGFVLAGGHASRMGFDKARAPWNGWPMAVGVLERLAVACGRVALVRRGPADGLPWVRPDGSPVEVVREADDEDRHPLWGVHTALSAARTDVVVVVPCDVPMLPPELVERLVDAAPSVVEAGGRVHPLVGAFPRDWAERAAELARSGGSVRAFASAAVRVEAAADGLVNVNDPSALASSPLDALLDGLPPEVAARARAAEAARRAARGIIPSTRSTTR